MFKFSFGGDRRIDLPRMAAAAFAWTLLLGAHSAFAQPGQNKEPWNGQKYDRAAMAVIMHQLDSGSSASSNSVTAGTTLVCGGGGGTSSATANSSCIIINNGSANINAGQASDGAQSAQSDSTTVTSDPNSMSSALSALVPSN